jgi:hypothetical protein
VLDLLDSWQIGQEEGGGGGMVGKLGRRCVLQSKKHVEEYQEVIRDKLEN